MNQSQPCSICQRPFTPKTCRAKTCSPQCSSERNRRTAAERYQNILTGHVPKPATWYEPKKSRKGKPIINLIQHESEELEPVRGDERMGMIEGVVNLCCSLADEVALIFAEAQSLRGVGASALRASDTSYGISSPKVMNRKRKGG